MFEKITPEQAGISSKSVTKFIKKLEKRGATTHGILMMRYGKIFAEAYWEPFHKDYCHRMYSQTKSFVGVAIGLLQEEGKLNINDKIINYFPEKIDGELPRFLENQTIREMLMMSTVGTSEGWWTSGDPDRTHHYMNNFRKTRPSGMIWGYDSPGSQVLSMLVEKLAKKPLLDYLKEKLFDKMGTFKTAFTLKTPNGSTWGDSAMICTLRDMASFGQLVMNYGVYNGQRLMGEQYLKEATSLQVVNSTTSHYSAYHQGYGYQIWRVCGNGFAFVGMGDQITICYPDKQLIFSCVSDNQGTEYVRQIIFEELEDEFVDKISDTPLAEDKDAEQEMVALISSLKLRCVKGEPSPYQDQLNGKKYVCEENSMGISEFTFNFNGESGEFVYKNAQGDKVIPFGINHNVFGKFPQFGYSNEYSTQVTTNGFTYKDAVSLAWMEEKKLILFVQIIDNYFGNMSAVFSFKDDMVYAYFTKAAELFLQEYEGVLIAKREK